jgi:hypothetical protein
MGSFSHRVSDANPVFDTSFLNCDPSGLAKPLLIPIASLYWTVPADRLLLLKINGLYGTAGKKNPRIPGGTGIAARFPRRDLFPPIIPP